MQDKFDNIFVFENEKILNALKALDKEASQFLMVKNSDEKLVGVITDGDVRRGLIKGLNLASKANEFMNKEFLYIHKSDHRNKAFDLMKKHSLKHIPVLDDIGKVIDVVYINENLEKILDNFIVIMAGGKGTRLYPKTKDCPKPMLKVAGKPMLEILLEQCISFGYRNFYISVNYLKESIMDYFEDGKKWGINIHYLEEDVPLGTAGSLSLLKKLPKLDFLVMNADILTKFNLRSLLEFHLKKKSDATLCVREYNYQLPFGVVKISGSQLVGFEEKPSFKEMINAGIYILNPKILSLLENNKYMDMPNLFLKAKNHNFNLNVCPVYEYWIDIGRKETLEKAHQEWNINE